MVEDVVIKMFSLLGWQQHCPLEISYGTALFHVFGIYVCKLYEKCSNVLSIESEYNLKSQD